MKNRNAYEGGEGDVIDFREDLSRRMTEDPAFASEYREARARASLGLKIARLRSARGLSQTQLASRLQTTQSVVSRIESPDYTGHKIETLRRVADALDLELVVDLREKVKD